MMGMFFMQHSSEANFRSIRVPSFHSFSSWKKDLKIQWIFDGLWIIFFESCGRWNKRLRRWIMLTSQLNWYYPCKLPFGRQLWQQQIQFDSTDVKTIVRSLHLAIRCLKQYRNTGTGNDITRTMYTRDVHKELLIMSLLDSHIELEKYLYSAIQYLNNDVNMCL